MKKVYPKVLIIAGSDSGGGAGIQADIKSVSACGAYASTAITAITAQNTLGVQAIEGLSNSIISKQITSVLSDIGADAIKIGMLHSKAVIQTVIEQLKKFSDIPIVIDPVMVATSGDRLLQKEAIVYLKNQLLPLGNILTPNIPEAELLLGKKINDFETLKAAAQDLGTQLNTAVYLKAGHFKGNTLVDVFYDNSNQECIELPSQRINTINTHGTGCSLSSAIAAYLAKGESSNNAVKMAKAYIQTAIESGSEYEIGQGNGPIHHFWKA